MAEHGSPLWLVDLDRVRTRLREFRGAWTRAWPDVEVAYSYKTNRLPAILRALAAEGAGHEVVCEAEYALARDAIGAAGPDVIVNGPVKSDALLERAAADGALVVVDSEPELTRAARAGVERVGLRVALPGHRRRADALRHRARAGARGRRPRSGARPRARGAERAPRLHRLRPAARRRPRASARRSRCSGRPPPRATRRRPSTWRDLAVGLGVDAIDLGGGFPAAPAVAAHAAAVVGALRSHGFAGRLILEPGRALVTDAVALAFSVVAVKQLDDGTRCVVVDAGTNLLPGALWSWPRIEAIDAGERPTSPALVSGPLCLNVDVLHPAAELPERGAGRRPARARRRRLSAGAIDALRRPAPRGGRPRRRPLAGLPAA